MSETCLGGRNKETPKKGIELVNLCDVLITSSSPEETKKLPRRELKCVLNISAFVHSHDHEETKKLPRRELKWS